MLIPGRLMKSALSGKLKLLPAAQALMDEVLTPQMATFDDDDKPLAAEQKLAKNGKKVALMTLGTAAQKYMMTLGDQQEVLLGIADIIMDTYAMESAILRAQTLAGMAEGDELRTLLAASRRFTKLIPMNTITARQRIADVLIEANKYAY